MGGVPARVPQAADRRLRRGGVQRARRLRVRVHAWPCKQADGGFAPLDESLCFSTAGMTTAAPVMDDIVAALEAQGIPVEQYYPELGHGQQELSIRHAPALDAADRQVFYRETVRAVAHRHGLWASLAPKPFVDQAGNGAHIHFSLWDAAGRRSRMHDPRGRYGVSALGYHFIAGVLEHLPGAARAHVSERELVPPAPAALLELRLHGVGARQPRGRGAGARRRFPSDRAGSTNAELKASDSSSNPYLALGGLLAAGLDGVTRALEPGRARARRPGRAVRERAARARDPAVPDHAGRGARSAGARRRAHDGARPDAGPRVPRREALGGARRSAARTRRSRRSTTSGSSELDLGAVPILDQHCHALLRDGTVADAADYARFFTESGDPTMHAHHVPETVFYRWAIRELAAVLDCAPTTEAVLAARGGMSADALAAAAARARRTSRCSSSTTATETDETWPPAELAARLPCRVLPILRLEALAQALIVRHETFDALLDAYLRVGRAGARRMASSGLKSIIAYRTGLAVQATSRGDAAAAFGPVKERARRDGRVRLAAKPLNDYLLLRALEIAERQAMPVQIHTGFGDADLDLSRGEPAAPAPAARERPVCERALRPPARELPLRPRARLPGGHLRQRLRRRRARHPASRRRDPDDAAPAAGPRALDQGGVLERRLADPRAVLAGRALGATRARRRCWTS